MDNMKLKTISSLIWKFSERMGAQIIQFVVSIVLARLLTPADYGLIGLITVFITVSLVFAQSGLGQALVQKKNADDIDFSSVFYFSLVFSVLIYVILFAVAPFIAHFYEEPILTNVVRVLGIVVIIGAVHSVQNAYVQKTMQFKCFFWSTLGGTLVSAAIGISMAYNGYGVWALVGQQISNQFANTIILFFAVKWRPKLMFSFERASRLFTYGWKMLVSSLIDTVYTNIHSLIIGKFYSASDLGFYSRGRQFPMLIIQNINTAIDTVLFPVMSEVQDEKARLKSMMRRSIVTSTFLIFPMMAGLAAIAEPITLLLLTEKWLPAVPFIQFCCFIFAFMPIHTANLQAIKALGRSDIFLGLEIAKKIAGILILIITLPNGLMVMMIGNCVSTIISSFINAFPNRKLLGYSYLEQIKDILPSIVISIIKLVCVLAVGAFNCNIIVKLILQVITGVVVYTGMAKLCKLECFEYILNIVKGFIKKGGQ